MNLLNLFPWKTWFFKKTTFEAQATSVSAWVSSGTSRPRVGVAQVFWIREVGDEFMQDEVGRAKSFLRLI